MKKQIEVVEIPTAMTVAMHVLAGVVIAILGFGSIPLLVNQTLLPGLFGLIAGIAAFFGTFVLEYYNIKLLLNKWKITFYED